MLLEMEQNLKDNSEQFKNDNGSTIKRMIKISTHAVQLKGSKGVSDEDEA